MSTQQAQAHNMTETSVIKHYKKRLIYRQHDDVPEDKEEDDAKLLNEVGNTKIYAFESDKNNRSKNQVTNNGRKIKRKRKNKNCRGQFRHEAMELIKLGSNASHTLCKTIKEPFSTRSEKPDESSPHGDEKTVPQYADNTKESSNQSVIHTTYANKTILEISQPKLPGYGHPLPQMVPERRNSREFLSKVIPVIYRSPPHRPPLPEYRVPASYPFPHPPYCHPPLTLAPPPPYPRSPPRPPIRPIPQPAFRKDAPYTAAHFGFPRHYTNGYHHPPVDGFPERRKRKLEEKEHPVVAAIDLTVDQNPHGKGDGHKCQCECGKTYRSDPVTQEVIITVKDKDSSQVPSTYMRGKMVNGVLQFDRNAKKSASNQEHTDNNQNPSATPTVLGGAPEGKLPQLFLIKDLLTKGVRVQPKSTDGAACKDKNSVPVRSEANRVIVSTKCVEEAPRPKSKDYTVNTIIGSSRRQSVDIDTISISSSGSDKSPRPKSNGLEKQIPHGKLFYYKNNNSFIRYFDDTQKKLFIDSITSDGQSFEKASPEEKEVIELPKNTSFSSKDNLTVEEYVSEMTLVEKFIPRDFFLFYKFVTGYQICNNNLPVSFLTFLKVYNTNGLKILFERYVSSLKQN